MNTIYCINELPYKDSNATALDNDLTEKYMCIGAPGTVSIMEGEKYTTTQRNIRTNRHSAHIIRWQRFGDTTGRHIVCASTQFFDIYVVGSDGLSLLGSTSAHPFILADVDCCSYDINNVVSCSIGDPVKCWDLRDLRRPCQQLQVIGGAEQAKWAPLALNLLCTSHGTDLRLWDIRNLSLPLQSVSAHMQKISCIMWHPTVATCFLTASHDGYIKMWNNNDLTKPRHSLGMLSVPVWKIKFSSDGNEFASIPVPSYGQTEENGALSLWKTSNLDLAQVIKCENDVLLDLCWQKLHIQRQTYGCLYSASRYGKLRKYNLPPLESSPKDMNTSCTSSVLHSNENAFSLDEEMKELKSILQNPVQNTMDGNADSDKGNPSDVTKQLLNGQKVEIIDNKLCLKMSGNLEVFIAELAFLTRMFIENVVVEQVSDMHIILAWSWDTTSKFPLKIALSLEEGMKDFTRVILEIVDEKSSLSMEEIKCVITKLSEEADVTGLLPDKEMILPVLLQKLLELLKSLKVITPRSLDIPQRPESAVQFCNGASMESGPCSVNLETLCAAVPKSTMSSPPLSTSYDRWIPFPRTCGARFNGSGLLVVFGRNERALRRMHSSKGSFQDESLWLSAERITTAMTGSSTKKGPFSFLGDGHETTGGGTPRSLDEYKHELLISTEEMHTRLQNFCAQEKCITPVSQSISGTPVFPSDMVLLHQKLDSTISQTPQQGMRASNSLAMLGSTRSSSMQNVRLHRRRGNSGTNVLADDHHRLDDVVSASVVVIYDVSILLSVSKDLARKYRLLGGNALELCIWNRKVVVEAGRKDLEKIWQMVELCVRLGNSSWRKHCTLDKNKKLSNVVPECDSVSENLSEYDSLALAMHPFGRPLINSLLDYFTHISDYQTAAMVICVLGLKTRRIFEKAEDTDSPSTARRTIHHGRSLSTCGDGPSGSIYSAIHANARLNSNIKPLQQEKEKREIAVEQVSSTVPSALRSTRKFSSIFQNAFIGHPTTLAFKIEQDGSPSCSHPTPNIAVSANPMEQSQSSVEDISRNKFFCSLLDPAYKERFDEVLQQYADLLFRWRMYSKAAEVMKYSEMAPYSFPLQVRSACPQCDGKMVNFRCNKCGIYWQFRCSFCQLPVQGLLTICALCGHGGHSEHMVVWFKENDQCAYGCGCDCKSACI